MADEDSTVRQRKPASEQKPEREATADSQEKKAKKKRRTRVEEEDDYTPWVDVLRVLTFLLLASCGVSYVISGGESWWWGMKEKPDVLTINYWKELLKGPDPPIYLTPDELAKYDGTDPELPVYIGLNGTVFDVSNGRHIYGPGGSYNVFAGRDAARAFVTGCFQDDHTADLRGLELMYLPLDDPETDSYWSEQELAALRVKELEAAKERAHGALLHWVNFFTNSKKYHKVGYIVRDKNWLEKEPLRQLCAPAQKGRKKRTIPTKPTL